MANSNTKSREPLMHILGLVLLVALIWFAFAVIEGLLKFLLVLLCIAAAVALVWRLIRIATRK